MCVSPTLVMPNTVDTPRRITVIMDGNDCWATERYLPHMAGHSRGLDAVCATVEAATHRGAGYLMLFAFSSESWRRPAEEVTFLMKLFMTALRRKVSKLHDNDIRLRIVGDLSALSPRIQLLIRGTEAKAVANPRLTVTILANYGGRRNILQTIRTLLAAQPDITSDAIVEEVLAPYMALSYVPKPDLFVRTGGEQRINNLLLRQLTYSKLYFTDRYWPDSDAAEPDRTFAWYHNREHHSGRISAQLDPDIPPVLSAGV